MPNINRLKYQFLHNSAKFHTQLPGSAVGMDVKICVLVKLGSILDLDNQIEYRLIAPLCS